MRVSGRRNKQIEAPRTWFAAGPDDGCRELAVASGHRVVDG
jgi:hypothetical protein